IYTGLDHLLFILLLILISPLLLINNNQWGNFSSWKFTIKRLLKIITAFTLGHCITLLIFSFFNLNGISKYIEICISLTIIATAVHCIKPYFYNKEVLITFIFGLIHGSAFGITLNEWGISKNQKLISLLGFNLGIELMQIIIVLFCIPLIYLSKYLIYNKIRVAVASVTIFISIFWTIERITGTPNIITEYINKII
ncbi:MAG: HupE/UreJ family protein, partial [Saprospiraceae bacterium]